MLSIVLYEIIKFITSSLSLSLSHFDLIIYCVRNWCSAWHVPTTFVCRYQSVGDKLAQFRSGQHANNARWWSLNRHQLSQLGSLFQKKERRGEKSLE